MPRINRDGSLVHGGRKVYGPGDSVEALAKAMGFDKCEDCEDRRVLLNNIPALAMARLRKVALPQAETAVAAERSAICEGCDQRYTNERGVLRCKSCAKCSDLLFKQSLRKNTCPKRLWPR